MNVLTPPRPVEFFEYALLKAFNEATALIARDDLRGAALTASIPVDIQAIFGTLGNDRPEFIVPMLTACKAITMLTEDDPLMNARLLNVAFNAYCTLVEHGAMLDASPLPTYQHQGTPP